MEITEKDVRSLMAKAYVLGNAGQERMIDNGWHIVCIRYPFESVEEIAEKLSGYKKVKIYESTTSVRGLHNYFAMVKWSEWE